MPQLGLGLGAHLPTLWWDYLDLNFTGLVPAVPISVNSYMQLPIVSEEHCFRHQFSLALTIFQPPSSKNDILALGGEL